MNYYYSFHHIKEALFIINIFIYYTDVIAYEGFNYYKGIIALRLSLKVIKKASYFINNIYIEHLLLEAVF